MSRAVLWPCLLLAGCAVTSGSATLVRESLRFEVAAPANAGWKHLQTEQFELFTDLPPPEAERAAALLTQSLEGLAAMFGTAKPEFPQRLVVIALADGLDFERRFGRRLAGFAAVNDPETTIVVYGSPDRWFVRTANLVDSTDSVLQHELAHAVLFRYVRRQPTWFAEGMAQYLETFRWLDAHTVVLGEPNLAAWQRYARVRSISMRDVLSWDTYVKRQPEVSGLYGLSWAFVHYALNVEPQRFSQLLAALVEGDDEAFVHTFGPQTDELDQAVHAYLKRGKYGQLTLDVPAHAPVTVKFEATPEPTERLRALEHDLQHMK